MGILLFIVLAFFLFYVNLKCAYLRKTRLKNARMSIGILIFANIKPWLQQKANANMTQPVEITSNAFTHLRKNFL